MVISRDYSSSISLKWFKYSKEWGDLIPGNAWYWIKHAIFQKVRQNRQKLVNFKFQHFCMTQQDPMSLLMTVHNKCFQEASLRSNKPFFVFLAF